MHDEAGLIEPKQQRSRETLTRLLNATLIVLDRHGLSGATIPKIAQSAGVAPASVYRRFRDRDALFRAAFLHALEQGEQYSANALKLENFRTQTLAAVAEEIISLVLRQYAKGTGILKAMIRFVENDTDKTFRVKFLTQDAANFERMIALLLSFREEIRHPDPRRAITFALLMVATAIEERALESVSVWHQLLPLSDEQLKPELVRMFLAYLHAGA